MGYSVAKLAAAKARRRLGAVRREVATFAAVAADGLGEVASPMPKESAAQALVARARLPAAWCSSG